MKTVGKFIGCVIALPIAVRLFPGVHAVYPQAAWIAGIMLGAVYLLLRPIVKFVLAPLNCMTMGLAGFLMDILFVYFVAANVAGIYVDGIFWAFITSLLVSLCREVVGSML